MIAFTIKRKREIMSKNRPIVKGTLIVKGTNSCAESIVQLNVKIGTHLRTERFMASGSSPKTTTTAMFSIKGCDRVELDRIDL